MVAVDDKTRKGYILLLRHKSDCVEAVKRLSAKIFNLTGRYPAYLRSDGESSLLSNELGEFLLDAGVQHEVTNPESSYQNGVAERYIQTIDNSATASMLHCNAPTTAWEDCVLYSQTCNDYTPHSSNPNGESPMQSLTGEANFWGEFQPFGCEAWPRLPGHHKKYSAKSVRCCFLGFGTNSPDQKLRKGYRLWDIANSRVIHSQHVDFFPHIFPWRERDSGKPMSHKLPSAETLTKLSSLPDLPELETPLHQGEHATPGADVSAADHQGEGTTISDQIEEKADAAPPKQQMSPPVQRKSGRVIRKPTRFLQAVASEKPKGYHPAQTAPLARNYTQAKRSPDAQHYLRALDVEVAKLNERNTLSELIELPPGKRAHSLKPIFKWRSSPDESSQTAKSSAKSALPVKARVVFGGNTQVKGIDFDEITSPTLDMRSVHLLFRLAAQYGVPVRHADAESAFTNAEMEEELYCRQIPGYEVKGQEHKVHRLLRALYGCKQSNRKWWKLACRTLLDEGFEQSAADECVFILRRPGKIPVIIGLYVDDYLSICDDSELYAKILAALRAQFDIKDLGILQSALGLRVRQDLEAGTLTIDQEQYIEAILEEYDMGDCNPVSTPHSGEALTRAMSPQTPQERAEVAEIASLYGRGVGMVKYVQRMTRPDISFSVRELSKFNSNPGRQHWRALKRLLRFLSGTKSRLIVYRKTEGPLELTAYCDSDFANDPDTRRSVTGWVTFLGEIPLTWRCEGQTTTAQSTAEAEYISAWSATREVYHLRNFLTEIGEQPTSATPLFEDNNACIDWAEGRGKTERRKHVDVKYHFVRDCVDDQLIEFRKISTKDQIADILTKPLRKAEFTHLQKSLVHKL